MMKKQTPILFTLISLFSMAYGQGGTPEVDIHISATVEETIEMSTLSNIDVGTIVPSNDRLKLDPRNAQGAGLIMVTGRAGSEVQVSFTARVEMTNVNSSIPLQVRYSISGNEENNQAASQLFTTNPTNILLSPQGEYYVWIGCEFELRNLVSGQYDGDFVVEVDYSQ